ncbi:hypothetical protein ScPMuIL_009546 [Solemya velum]
MVLVFVVTTELVSDDAICNRINECPDGSDELGCPIYIDCDFESSCEYIFDSTSYYTDWEKTSYHYRGYNSFYGYGGYGYFMLAELGYATFTMSSPKVLTDDTYCFSFPYRSHSGSSYSSSNYVISLKVYQVYSYHQTTLFESEFYAPATEYSEWEYATIDVVDVGSYHIELELLDPALDQMRNLLIVHWHRKLQTLQMHVRATFVGIMGHAYLWEIHSDVTVLMANNGRYCEKEKGDNSTCASNPCLNGGTCTPEEDSFSCLCEDSHTGLLCEEETCDAGNYPDPEGNCVECDIGYYKEEQGNWNCSMCPKGLTTLGTGATSAEKCNQCLGQGGKLGVGSPITSAKTLLPESKILRKNPAKDRGTYPIGKSATSSKYKECFVSSGQKNGASITTGCDTQFTCIHELQPSHTTQTLPEAVLLSSSQVIKQPLQHIVLVCQHVERHSSDRSRQ